MTENTSKAPLQMATSQEDDKKGHAKEHKKDSKEGNKKALTFTLSFSSVTTVCVVLLGGIFMAFMLGVMVGRGENPESHMAPLTTLLPSDQYASGQDTVDEQGANGSLSMEGTESGQEASTDSNASDESQKIMPAEDLNYARELKTKPGQENVKAAVDTTPMQATQPQMGFAPTVPVQQAPASVPAPAQAPAQVPAQVPVKPPVQPSAQIEKTQNDPVQAALDVAKAQQVYDYVFQVATFTSADSVDRLRERLEGENYRTRMEKSGKFFRVLVLLRGNEAQAQALRKHMLSLKLGEPMQKGKKAVQ